MKKVSDCLKIHGWHADVHIPIHLPFTASSRVWCTVKLVTAQANRIACTTVW